MFARSRKRCERADGASSTSHGAIETRDLPRHELAWRGAAQQVRRAWSEWSAADQTDRAALFDRYQVALLQEERAAIELERAIAGPARASDTGDSSDSTLAVGERRER